MQFSPEMMAVIGKVVTSILCLLFIACIGVIVYSIWQGIKLALQKELKERCRDLEYRLELAQKSIVQLRARNDLAEATAKLQMAISNMWQNAYLHELGAPTKEDGARPSLILIVSRDDESGRFDA